MNPTTLQMLTVQRLLDRPPTASAPVTFYLQLNLFIYKQKLFAWQNAILLTQKTAHF